MLRLQPFLRSQSDLKQGLWGRSCRKMLRRQNNRKRVKQPVLQDAARKKTPIWTFMLTWVGGLRMSWPACERPVTTALMFVSELFNKHVYIRTQPRVHTVNKYKQTGTHIKEFCVGFEHTARHLCLQQWMLLHLDGLHGNHTPFSWRLLRQSHAPGAGQLAAKGCLSCRMLSEPRVVVSWQPWMLLLSDAPGTARTLSVSWMSQNNELFRLSKPSPAQPNRMPAEQRTCWYQETFTHARTA